ncbi:transglutaminase-like cysteine peptidase [Kordiimonas marina]|uniref:transglutaminase-like cysteine peptidase n=1 Tax=Kordiimonas marina TaxID=2872312 RepID=UPI001FF260BA|nr:transglutaminase-like cysteine peptidase [Kordiimonas marina]MCJ9429533.1 transglutaminase-like cysteine peptidase [Kordiimonas marina]
MRKMSKTVLLMISLLNLSACMGVMDQSSHALAPSGLTPTAPGTATEGSKEDTAQGTMPHGTTVPAPQQFEIYCEKNPADCAIPSTPAINKAIARADRDVHKMIKPTEEKVDVWTALSKAGAGDCEDFALTLRKRLRENFPAYAGAFRIATAYTETGEYHAVLSIETSGGTIVCDIRYQSCAPWQNFPYQWRLREIPGSRKWQEMGPYRMTPEEKAAKAKLMNTADIKPRKPIIPPTREAADAQVATETAAATAADAEQHDEPMLVPTL